MRSVWIGVALPSSRVCVRDASLSMNSRSLLGSPSWPPGRLRRARWASSRTTQVYLLESRD